MTDSQSVAHILGTMATAIKVSLKNPGSSDTMGAAVSLGLCLAVLRVVGSAYRSSTHLENGDQFDAANNKTSSASSAATLSHFIMSYMTKFLRRVLLADDADIMEDDLDPNLSSCITHAGSCHCDSVQFEVVAPRCLQARDGVGKIQYRHTKVKTSNFKVFKGHEFLKTYYVVSNGTSDKGAHAFCQNCGVHILYAPWKNSPHLFINVNCLAQGIRKVRLARGAEKILDAVPADAQWETLSTVSEVSGDSRWNFFQHQESAGSGASYSDTNTWKYDRPIDELSVSPSLSEFSYNRKPHQFSHSPTLTSTTESQMSSDASYLLRREGDDSTVRSYKSTRSATSYKSSRTAPTISLQPLNSRLESPAEQQLSPAMRNQMKKYMARHVTNNVNNGEVNKVQTMKKQNINLVDPAKVPAGEENKVQL
jgi:hypothetical protein